MQIRKEQSIKKSIKNSLLVAGAISTIGIAGLAAQTSASAQGQGGMSGLVDKIATKFNLSKDDVQKFFDEEHASREAEQEKKQSERLQKLVDEGKITASQKTALEAKLKELKAEREANKGSMSSQSPEERKAKMQEHREEMEEWAKSQGIDLTKLDGLFMGRRGMGGPRGMGHHHDD